MIGRLEVDEERESFSDGLGLVSGRPSSLVD